MTGNHPLNNTQNIYGVTGTDIGIMWDNGMVDDPATTDVNEHQVLIAFGDTFGIRGYPARSLAPEHPVPQLPMPTWPTASPRRTQNGSPATISADRR